MTKKMPGFKEYLDKKSPPAFSALFEHEVYKRFPGTSQSYRKDSANTTTKVAQHVHAYAKLNGQGGEIYSATVDGKGHDGSTGIEIPGKHADHLRTLGYKIPDTNILESIAIPDLDPGRYSIIYIDDGEPNL